MAGVGIDQAVGAAVPLKNNQIDVFHTAFKLYLQANLEKKVLHKRQFFKH